MDLLTFYLLGEILAVSMGVRQPDTPLRSIFTSGDESIPAEADHLQIEISHTHIHAKDALVQLERGNVEHEDFIFGTFESPVSEEKDWWLSVQTDLAATHSLVVEPAAALLHKSDLDLGQVGKNDSHGAEALGNTIPRQWILEHVALDNDV